MATHPNRSGQDALSPEQLARVEVIRARRRTSESREADAALRASLDRERAETGLIATTGEKITMEDAVAFRQYIMNLRRCREEQGLSLDEVAARSGIDKAALSRLESGKQMNPTVNTLMRYSRAIERPVFWGPPVVEAGDVEREVITTSPKRREVG